MKNLFKTASLPIGVFALAICSAFSTNAMKEVIPVQEMGYQQLNAEGYTCVKQKECANVGVQVCTWKDPATNLSHDLYGLDKVNNQTICTRQLFRIE